MVHLSLSYFAEISTAILYNVSGVGKGPAVCTYTLLHWQVTSRLLPTLDGKEGGDLGVSRQRRVRRRGNCV
jgi:hypothetical protein